MNMQTVTETVKAAPPVTVCIGCAYVGLGRWPANVRGVELVALQAAPVIVTLP